MPVDSVNDMTDCSLGHRLTDSGTASADRSVGSLADGRAVLAAATKMLRELPGVLWQSTGGELGELMGQLDDVAALAGGVRVAVTAEALERGEIADSQCAGTRGWVAQHAPSLAMGAGQVARVVEQTGSAALAPVRETVIAGRLPVPVALVVLSEFDKLRRRIVPDAETMVLDGLIRIGVEDGSREVRRLRPAMLAKYGAADELQRDQDRAARLVSLSHAVCTDEGVWEYRFVADVEAKAVLEAAIGPLSAPWHPDGQRDVRSAQQRRGQALVEVCRRVTEAAKAAGVFGGYPQGSTGRVADCGSERPGPRATSGDQPGDHTDDPTEWAGRGATMRIGPAWTRTTRT